MKRDCNKVLSITEQYCIIYLGESIPEVDLINGECYPLDEIFQKLWQWISYLISGGTTTSTTSTSSTTTTTTTQSFDTSLDFISSTTSSSNGVTAQALALNANLKFEFDMIDNPIGLYNVMTISVSGAPILQITYRSDYIGQSFKFTHTNGTVYFSTFGPDKNF